MLDVCLIEVSDGLRICEIMEILGWQGRKGLPCAFSHLTRHDMNERQDRRDISVSEILFDWPMVSAPSPMFKFAGLHLT